MEVEVNKNNGLPVLYSDDDIVMFIITIIAVIISACFFTIIAYRKQKVVLMQENVLEQKEKNIEQIAADQHEFARHLGMIQAFADSYDSREALDMIKGYLSAVTGKNNLEAEPILKVYLDEKTQYAKENGIKLKKNLLLNGNEFPFSTKELIEVVGNLIDNAFEMVILLPEKHRTVFFELGERDGNKYIKMQNRLMKGINADKSEMLKPGVSTKEGVQRGYGLVNVESIAGKYNGKLSMDIYDDNITCEVIFIEGK